MERAGGREGSARWGGSMRYTNSIVSLGRGGVSNLLKVRAFFHEVAGSLPLARPARHAEGPS
jgi:hypothetical protein